MSEEYGNDFVTLIDEDGNEVEFEHIDTVAVSYTHLPRKRDDAGNAR